MGFPLNKHRYADAKPMTPGEFTPLPAGGYVCVIVNAAIGKSKAGRDMLTLAVDISQGSFAGYFRDEFERLKKFDPNRKWPNSGTYRQLILDSSGNVGGFFRGLIDNIEHSNQNFRINSDDFEPATLIGKFCGFVFGEEPYTKNDGSEGKRVVIKFPTTVEKINSGDFKIPDAKKSSPQKKSSDTVSSDDDPFAQAEPVDNDDTPF